MKRATLAIILRDGMVLLGEKKSGAEIGSGTLNGPGGKCNGDETGLACVSREVREEVGLDIPQAHFEHCATVVFFAAGVPDFEVEVYRTKDPAGTPVETDEMIPSWHSVTQLPFDRMLESDRMWFSRAITGTYFRAHVYYRERAKGFERIEFL